MEDDTPTQAPAEAVSPDPVRAVSINFGDTTTMGASESAGVVAKTSWNSVTGNTRSTPLALKDETGASNGATATWTADSPTPPQPYTTTRSPGSTRATVILITRSG